MKLKLSALSLASLVLFVPFSRADLVSTNLLSAPVTSGSIVNVNITINNVVDLYAWQFDLAFTPGLLDATSITEASFLANGGQTFFVPGLIDNSAGSVTYTADTLLGPISGVDGTGTLAIAHFIGVGDGIASFSVSNIILLDSQGNMIPNTTSVPEPATRCVMLICFLTTLLVRTKVKTPTGSDM